MIVTAISDLHGQLNFTVPEADLLLIAGDLCPAYHDSGTSIRLQENWLNSEFRFWLLEQPVKECVFISGNHDWIWEVAPKRVPLLNDNFHYLEDRGIEILGLKIYGTPVQPLFNNWAFNRKEEKLQKHWDNIPKGLDILLTHCPPYGILDKTHHPEYEPEHIGSKSLLKKIEKVRPTYSVYGHNHSEHGTKEIDGITYINASMVDERYNLTREPIILEI